VAATRSDRVALRAITPDATPEEVAAITAAVAASMVRPVAAVIEREGPEVSNWVLAPRLSGRRSGYARGEWRLSGRMGRRSRA
jgi:hypothetical protein